MRQQAKNPGWLTSCLSCGAIGRRMNGHYREPARSVRAINIADVHVLTHDMVHHAQRRRGGQRGAGGAGRRRCRAIRGVPPGPGGRSAGGYEANLDADWPAGSQSPANDGPPRAPIARIGAGGIPRPRAAIQHDGLRARYAVAGAWAHPRPRRAYPSRTGYTRGHGRRSQGRSAGGPRPRAQASAPPTCHLITGRRLGLIGRRPIVGE